MRGSALAALALLAVACSGCSSVGMSKAPVEYDDEGGVQAWQDTTEVKLPAYPKPENLVQVKGVAAGHRFFVDAPSVHVTADGVVRYTAVMKTAGGATNVAFEGMRCESREMRLYAVGHADGKWAESRNAKWQRIVEREKPYQFTLFREYFCPSPAIPTPPRRAVDAIRRGVSLNTRTTDN